MKLIYLYVKKFKVFSNREFRLDSEFEIHYETNKGRLTIQRRAGLKPDFWFLGVSPTQSPVVCLCDCGGKRSGKNDICPNSPRAVLWDDGDTCYDLSTTGLLLSYVRELNVRDKDVFTAFDIDEKRRVLEFLSFVENTRHQLPERTPDFPIRYPVAVWLEIEKLAIQRARDAITRRQEVFRGSGGDSSAEITHAEKGCLTTLDRIRNQQNPFGKDDAGHRGTVSYLTEAPLYRHCFRTMSPR